MAISKRMFLQQMLLGTGALAGMLFGSRALSLRALATGIPVSVLMNPLAANAANVVSENDFTLIFSTESSGGGINCNCPGSYLFGSGAHPRSTGMVEVNVKLGSGSYQAAKPWAALNQTLLDRTAFIHHATYVGGHSDHGRMINLGGATKNKETLPSLIAQNIPTAPALQVAPFRVGGSGFSFTGRGLPLVPPSAIKDALGRAEGPLASLQDIRDRDLDALHTIYKRHGTAAQLKMLDQFALSRETARNISVHLLDRLDVLDTLNRPDGNAGQAAVVPILIAMNISPVIAMGLGSGGDNHFDTGLQSESNAQIAVIPQIGNMMAEVDSLKAIGAISPNKKVIFAMMNVFGRVLGGNNGRQHASNHSVMVLMGDSVNPGVYGGWNGNKASAIDSASGAATAGGDIPFKDLLSSTGKTLCAAVGLQQKSIDENISQGKIIEAVINS